MRTFSRLAFSSLLFCLLVGCGGGPTGISVTGKVTNDDQPLTTGTVTFHADDAKGNSSGTLAAATIDGQGSYNVFAPAGWYKVTVLAEEARPEDGPDAYAEPKYLVAKQYVAVEDTPLSIEVKSGASAGAYDLKLSK